MKLEISEELIEQFKAQGWTLTSHQHTINPKKHDDLFVRKGLGPYKEKQRVIPYHEILKFEFIKVKE